jgi:hypothetical protein
VTRDSHRSAACEVEALNNQITTIHCRQPTAIGVLGFMGLIIDSQPPQNSGGMFLDACSTSWWIEGNNRPKSGRSELLLARSANLFAPLNSR